MQVMLSRYRRELRECLRTLAEDEDELSDLEKSALHTRVRTLRQSIDESSDLGKDWDSEYELRKERAFVDE